MRGRQAEWQNIIDHDDRPWHPDHIRSRILDAEEQQALQGIWRRVGLIWAVFGNVILVAAAIVVTLLSGTAIERLRVYIYALAVLSLAGSPFLIYYQYKRTRKVRLFIKKLNLVLRKNKHLSGDEEETQSDPVLAHQKQYRDEMPDVIADFREGANKYRSVHNRWQSVIIIGSVLTSAITTASVSFGYVRWVAVVVSFIVGLAAGFTGYFKYRERSFNLQWTSDAIEREYQSVELRVGKYANRPEPEAYALFASVVEQLRDEQAKRQQQLDQHVEIKRDQ
jgi:hypothetical protein